MFRSQKMFLRGFVLIAAVIFNYDFAFAVDLSTANAVGQRYRTRWRPTSVRLLN
jgi:hypothetical protein